MDRQPLDARAHVGEGEDAALEAGAKIPNRGSQRLFSELQTGARFTFDHDADSGHTWTKTGRREYSRIETKRIGSTSAPVTTIAPVPDDEGDAVVMLRNLATLITALRAISRIKRDGNDVIAASDLDGLLATFIDGSMGGEARAAVQFVPAVQVIESARPSIYPCGCSRLKVAAGLCSIYDETGTERSE